MGIGGRFLKGVVKNDAMKVDPPEIYNPRVFMLALCSCFGGALFGMDIGIIGGVISLDTFQTYVISLTTKVERSGSDIAPVHSDSLTSAMLRRKKRMPICRPTLSQ